MFKAFQSTAWLLFCLLLTGMAGIAWRGNPTAGYGQAHRDTIPPGKPAVAAGANETVINGDIDKALASIDQSMEQLRRQDWQKIQQDMQKAMQQLNADAMQKQMNAALLQLDAQKLQLDAQKVLQKTDWQKMEQDFQEAIKEAKDNIDPEKLQDQLREALASAREAVAKVRQTEMDKISVALEKARTELKNNQEKLQHEMAKARKDLKASMQRDWQKEMENARTGMEAAKEELRDFKTMLSEMEQDGLLNAKGSYTVEYRNGKLTINGKEQPKEITDKYRHYFKKDNITLKKEGRQ